MVTFSGPKKGEGHDEQVDETLVAKRKERPN
jgi:hypothetical protein